MTAAAASEDTKMFIKVRKVVGTAMFESKDCSTGMLGVGLTKEGAFNGVLESRRMMNLPCDPELFIMVEADLDEEW